MQNTSVKKAVYTYCPDFLHSLLNRIEASDIGYRLVRGVFWSMAGIAISRGLMMIASIFVARLLGKTVYGELGMVQSTVGMLGVFAGFGLGLTATKHVAEFRQSDPERTGRIIALSWAVAFVTGSLMALTLFIFSPWLAAHAINAPQLAGVLRISAIIMFINAINGVQTGTLSGFEAFKTIANVNLFVGLISFPIFIIGAYLGGLTGAVWALAINLGVNWLLNHIALHKEAIRHDVSFTFRNCSHEFPILWKFSLPAVLASSMVGPINWICSALLVNQINGYDNMGVYMAAYQWDTILTYLPWLFCGVVLPVISERLGEKDLNKSIKTIILAVKLNALWAIPLVVLGSIASPYIMSFYGDSFRSGWPTLVVVLCTAGLIAIHSPVAQIITASGNMWILFIMNAGWALIFVSATLLLVDKGSIGLASARAISYVFHVTWTFAFAYYIVLKWRKGRAQTDTTI
jgi:O-antigen/teichoic acid export membrane protein